jgi:quinol monooxygenase YgiN
MVNRRIIRMYSNEIVLIGEATAVPGKRDELRRALEELLPQSLAEGGVRTYRLHEDRHRPGHFALYERFHDQHAVDLHVQTEHFALALQALAELAEGGGPKITYYQTLSH